MGVAARRTGDTMAADDDRQELLDAVRTGTVPSFWARRQPETAAILSDHGNLTFHELDEAVADMLDAIRASRSRKEAPGL